MFPFPREGKPESVVVRDGEVGAGSSWLLLCLAWFFNKVSFWKQRLKTFFFFLINPAKKIFVCLPRVHLLHGSTILVTWPCHV